MSGGGFAVLTEGCLELGATHVMAASGVGNPHIPALPGLDDFSGAVLHSSAHGSPAALDGQRVVVVGVKHGIRSSDSRTGRLPRLALH